MQRTKHEISDVIYNAAEQKFEALVTFHTSDGRMSYAASFPAPLDASYETATAGLIREARRQVRDGARLVGVLPPHITAPAPMLDVWQSLPQAA